MKIKSYIQTILAAFLLAAFFTGCSGDELIEGGDAGNKDGKVTLVLSIPVSKEVVTRSTDECEHFKPKVNDLLVLGKKNEAYVILYAGTLDNCNELSEKQNLMVEFEIVELEGYDELSVVANTGINNLFTPFIVNDLLQKGTEGKLETESRIIPILNGNLNGKNVNYPAMQTIFTIENLQRRESIELIPPYSMISFQMVNNSDYEIKVSSVEVLNLPSYYSLQEGYVLEGETSNNIQWYDNVENPITLSRTPYSFAPSYILENLQGEIKNSTTPKGKVPSAFTGSNYEEAATGYTYIKVIAKRYGQLEGDDCPFSDITYRFLLGGDVVKDCNVRRNTHYKIKLSLAGNCGVDEATWRVQTNWTLAGGTSSDESDESEANIENGNDSNS